MRRQALVYTQHAVCGYLPGGPSDESRRQVIHCSEERRRVARSGGSCSVEDYSDGRGVVADDWFNVRVYSPVKGSVWECQLIIT